MSRELKTREHIGDRYILCTFPLLARGEPFVLESSNDLADVYKAAPEHLDDSTTCLSICEVLDCVWVTHKNDQTESTPVDITTLSEIEFHAQPAEED